MKLLMLAKSSLKKNRSSAITLLLLIITATLFLYIGLHVLSNLGSFLDNKHSSVNGADIVILTPQIYESYIADTLIGMEGVEASEQESAVIYHAGSIENKKVEEKAQSVGIILMNADQARDIQKIELIDAADTMTEDSIILPYTLHTTKGYNVGDEIEIASQGKARTYTVHAFCEDIFFSTTSNISFYKCFIPDTTFQKLYSSVSEVSKYSCVKGLLEDGISSGDFEGEFVKAVSVNREYESGSTITLNYEAMKMGTTTTISILMVILVFFASLVIIISMVVIRFTVINHIEQDIKNIGSMEAIGFTNRMIQNSLIMEFLFITVIGFVIGVILSLLFSDTVTNIISSSIGLNWRMEPGVPSMLISFATIALMILIITYKVTRRIAKITPLMALRNGIDTYHFGKNHFPLERTKGNLQLLLGFKQIFNNKKQSISISIITTLVSFIIVFAISMYFNFVQDETAFLRLVGVECSDLMVINYGDDFETVYDLSKNTPGIAHTVRYSNESLTLHYGEEEISTNTFICDDYNKLTISTIIEGRYPKHANEIALSTVNQRKLSAEIGNVISIKYNDQLYEYMVVGITQHIENMGESVSITEEGALRFNPSFIPVTLYLYLEEGIPIPDTIKVLEDKLANYNISVVNSEEIFATTLSSITQSISMICFTIGIITSLIVVLILYYLVKVKILRERNLIGISKAMGFTTGQLVLQNNITLCTIVLIGTLIGSVLAVFTVNPICSLMLKAVGIRNGNFAILPGLIGISLLLMEALTLVTTTLVSVRIRKVNPRELMAD